MKNTELYNYKCVTTEKIRQRKNLINKEEMTSDMQWNYRLFIIFISDTVMAFSFTGNIIFYMQFQVIHHDVIDLFRDLLTCHLDGFCAYFVWHCCV